MTKRAAGVRAQRPRRLDPPRLTRGPLSGTVYVVTVGRVAAIQAGREIIDATTKYDVTDQFDTLLAEHPTETTLALANELLHLLAASYAGRPLKFSPKVHAVAVNVVAAAARGGRRGGR